MSLADFVARAERDFRAGVECGEIALALGGPAAGTAAAAICFELSRRGFNPAQKARELVRRLGIG